MSICTCLGTALSTTYVVVNTWMINRTVNASILVEEIVVAGGVHDGGSISQASICSGISRFLSDKESRDKDDKSGKNVRKHD